MIIGRPWCLMRNVREFLLGFGAASRAFGVLRVSEMRRAAHGCAASWLAVACGVLGGVACEEPAIIITRGAPAATPSNAEAVTSAQVSSAGTSARSTPTGGTPSNGATASGTTTNSAPASGGSASLGSGANSELADAMSADALVRQSAPSRLIAIGDVHGDLSATRAALRLGGAIDAKDVWIGGDLTVVQTGDQLDRGDDERQILDLFERLAHDAAAAGGRFIALNGNHETMNVQGDFRYVTPAGFRAFDGVTPSSPHAGAAPLDVQSRAAAFLPGGAYALLLAKRDVIAVVGDSVFVHGGVLPEHVTYGIERINRETRAWMQRGDRVAPTSIGSDRAPVWVRDYSLDPVSAETCATLARVLDALKIKRMVVGHTVQQTGVTSACDERVWRIDVGLSRYYGANPISVLEINAGVVRPLTGPR